MAELGLESRHGRGRIETRALLAAVTLLTRLPVGGRIVVGAEDVARSGPAFPLVGAGIGAAVGGTVAALAAGLTPLLAAGIALALGALLTGALHLDGLGDTADALGGGSRSRALEVMRDHSVGAYGAVAIGLDLLLKAAALGALVPHERVVGFAIVAGALSRLAPVVLAAFLPYARPGGGVGASLVAGGRARALLTVVVALLVAAAAEGVDGLLLGAAALAATAALATGFRAWLAGVTGDALGAATELVELLVLVLAVALVGAR